MKYLTLFLCGLTLCGLSVYPASGQGKPKEDDGAGAENVLDKQSQEIKQTLFKLRAGVRSYRVRYDDYPAELGQLVDRGLIQKVPADPWGTAIRYTFFGADESGNDPHYELRSAGADLEFNSDDDITYGKDGLRLKLSQAQRTSILEDAGRNHTMSRQAWAWEQAYRLWLEIAEHEFREGKRVSSLKSLTLPEDAFPTGEPVDEFGRTLEFRDVRGVRAVLAPEVDSLVPALSLSESEFVHYLQKRLPTPENDDWRLRQVMEGVLKFRQLNGRLPLTMQEVTGFLRNNWISRNNDLFYLTLSNDTTFVIISCGADVLPGGRNENLDTIVYGPKNALGDDDESQSSWWDTSSVHREMYKDIKSAIVDKYSGEEDVDAGENGDDSFEIEGMGELDMLPPGVREQIEEALKKAAAEGFKPGGVIQPKVVEDAAAAEEEVAEEAVEEDVAEEGSAEDTASEKSSAEEDPAESGSDDTVSPDENVQRKHTLGSTLGLSILLPELATLLLAQDEKPAEPQAYKLKGPEELVPSTLYTQDEARELSIFTMEEWRTYRFTNPVRSLFSEAWSFKDKVGPDATLPCGNVELSNAETFVRMSDAKSWTENDYWDENAEDPFAAFLITKMERDEYNNLKSLVCIGIPSNQNTDPIVVFALIDGNQMGPFFSRVSDQPVGWLEQVMAYNGVPAEEAAEDQPADESGSESNNTPGDESSR